MQAPCIGRVSKDEHRETVNELVSFMNGNTSKVTRELTQKAKDLLAKRGFDPVLGARPLRRTIQREIEDQLSEKHPRMINKY